MSRHLPLILTLAACIVAVASHHMLHPRWITETPEPSRRSLAVKKVEKPDFAAIKPVKKRKTAFFTFFEERVEKRNVEILALRQQIEDGQLSDEEWLELAKRYRIKSDDPTVIRERLLIKVDAIPPSLVLAQAAIESAWGTSRFAVEGNNYFGQWCFREGCGLVPESRGEGKRHEVRLFDTPQASVNSYMRNLNSHPAYRDLRQTRATLRAESQEASGCVLALGLEHYSEKGHAYVESLKQLIRVNKLEQDPQGHCAAVMLAEEPEPETPEEPTDMAADDTQGQVIPEPEAAPPAT